VVTTQPAGGAHLAALATPEVAQQQQQSPSIILQDRATTFNLLYTVAHPQPLTQLHTETTPTAVCRSRPTERGHASQRRVLRGAAVRRCAVITSSDRDSSIGAGSFESFWANFENCATYIIVQAGASQDIADG